MPVNACLRAAAFIVTLTMPVQGLLAVEAEPEPYSLVRQRVLTEALRALATPHIERLSSLLYPLVNDYRATGHPATGRLLERAAAWMEGIRPGELGCEALVELQLAALLLERVGMGTQVPELGARAAQCASKVGVAEQAGLLFAQCRFGSGPSPDARATLQRLAAMQWPDGSFGGDQGVARYYRSSHAIFALYVCDLYPDVVARGQGYLISQLTRFRRIGFLDGILETLVMLDEMNVAVPGRRNDLRTVRGWIRPDGGICYMVGSGCESHWHSTGLLTAHGAAAPGAQGGDARPLSPGRCLP